MAKTLKNGLSMIETNPLNHNWSHFVILLGLTLHQFKKKLLLSLDVLRRAQNSKKIFHFQFDVTQWHQILSRRFFQILWPSQNIRTLPVLAASWHQSRLTISKPFNSVVLTILPLAFFSTVTAAYFFFFNRSMYR